MKYSFMSFSTPAMDLAGMLDAARQYGYDGIEPRTDAKHAHGVEVTATADEREAIRATVEASGIVLACLATSISYADPTKADDMVAQTHERIDLAGDVGAPAIRVFGGRIPEGISREAAIEGVAAALAKVAGHAAERRVTICLETHDDWCNPAHVAEVLARVSHPAIAANWDIMHPVRTGKVTMDEAFESLKPWIKHLHIHDGQTEGESKLTPIGSGGIDHRRALKLLKEIGYTGFLSGEWINWEPAEVHLPREIATMRGYERE